MAQPARRGLRPARRSGLTSHDPARTPTAATATRTLTPAREPRTSRRTGERQDTHARIHPGKPPRQEPGRRNKLPESAGGLRLSRAMESVSAIALGASSASSAHSSMMTISVGMSRDIAQVRLPAAAGNAARASSTATASRRSTAACSRVVASRSMHDSHGPSSMPFSGRWPR
jgi:hypothetical protein